MTDLNALSPEELAELKGAVQSTGTPTLPSGAPALSPEEIEDLRAQVLGVGAEVPTPGAQPVKQAGSALARGALSTGTFLGRVAKEAVTAPSLLEIGTPPSDNDVMADVLRQTNARGTEALNAADEQINKFGTQPRPGNVGDAYLESGMRGVGAGAVPLAGWGKNLANVGRTVVENALLGGAAGVAGEAADQFVERDEANPMARLSAALVTALAIPTVSKKIGVQIKGTKEQLAREIMDGMTPAEVAAANRAFDEFGAEKLIPILSQTTENPKIKALGEILYETGPKTRGVILGQADDIAKGVAGQQGKLGGKVLSEVEANNAMQTALTAEREAAIQARTAKYDATVNAPGMQGNRAVSMRQVHGVAENLRRQARAMPLTASRKRLESLADKLDGEASDLVGKPFNYFIQRLKAERSDLGKALDSGTGKPLQKSDSAMGVNALTAEMDRLMTPAYKRADAAYEADTKAINEAFAKSPAGRLIGTGASNTKESGLKLFRLFDSGTVNPGRSEIRFVGRMANRTPEGAKAFHNGFVSWIANKVASGGGAKPSTMDMDTTIGSIIGQTTGGGAAKNVQALRDGITTIVEGRGGTRAQGEAAAQGFIRFLETSRRLTKNVPRGHGEAIAKVQEIAGKTTASQAAGFPYLGNAKRQLERFYSERTYEHMDELFSSKEGFALLQKLADKATTQSVADRAIIGYLAGHAGGTNDLPSDQSTTVQE